MPVTSGTETLGLAAVVVSEPFTVELDAGAWVEFGGVDDVVALPPQLVAKAGAIATSAQSRTRARIAH